MTQLVQVSIHTQHVVLVNLYIIDRKYTLSIVRQVSPPIQRLLHSNLLYTLILGLVFLNVIIASYKFHFPLDVLDFAALH